MGSGFPKEDATKNEQPADVVFPMGGALHGEVNLLATILVLARQNSGMCRKTVIQLPLPGRG
jgi:hypothetical protein